MEEAYNQEPGVVQHISAFQLFRGADSWAYSFTEEWPLFGRTHQLSYTLPIQRTHNGSAVATGLDRKSTRLNSSHQIISYAVFCLKKKKKKHKKHKKKRKKTQMITHQHQQLQT